MIREGLPTDVFWLVYGMGQGSPTHRHATQESAANEAKRLARAHKGVAFVVLEATGAVICDDLHTVSFRKPTTHSDDIPF